MRAGNETVRQELAELHKEGAGKQEKKGGDYNGCRNKAQVREQAVESEGEIRVVVRGVIVWAFLEGILEGVTVKANSPVRQTVKVAVGGDVPQQERNAQQKQNRNGFVHQFAHGHLSFHAALSPERAQSYQTRTTHASRKSGECASSISSTKPHGDEKRKGQAPIRSALSGTVPSAPTHDSGIARSVADKDQFARP